MNILEKIKVIGINPDKYYREYTDKSQIVLHHTVSGFGIKGDINWWLQDPKRICTAFIIHHDGTPYQLFSTDYWANHLGITTNFLQKQGFKIDYRVRNKFLNMHSIAIELDNWGPLLEHDGKFYPVKLDGNSYLPNLNTAPIPEIRVNKFEKLYRGFYAFEKYTKEQIESLRELLIYFNKKWNIPLDYKEDMWDISLEALNGISGIWTHCSYVPWKSDCSPDPELIKMLKSLNNGNRT